MAVLIRVKLIIDADFLRRYFTLDIITLFNAYSVPTSLAILNKNFVLR